MTKLPVIYLAINNKAKLKLISITKTKQLLADNLNHKQTTTAPKNNKDLNKWFNNTFVLTNTGHNTFKN